MFKFVKVINRNMVSFPHFRYNKNGIFDDVIIMSALHNDTEIEEKILQQYDKANIQKL